MIYPIFVNTKDLKIVQSSQSQCRGTYGTDTD